ncbi:cupin 4 family protein [Nitzschia inconspicua]|uniref:Bifunctional lysine-specific demethylase and histidyl-hydroxylase n=1 Tax=Nitzschia inconspicua TaxID=303405 RepID=A0A9K3Q2Y6_9STRA|nr:cupin 4 family protein [Nitzschia inconspicua]
MPKAVSLLSALLYLAVLSDSTVAWRIWGQKGSHMSDGSSCFCCRGGGEAVLTKSSQQLGGGHDGDDHDAEISDRERRVLQDIDRFMTKTSQTSASVVQENPLVVPIRWEDVEEAINDLTSSTGSHQYVVNEKESQNSDRATTAWSFLRGLAESDTFLTEFWHQRPLLIRAAEMPSASWVDGIFTLEHDLKEGVDNSYIAGHKTADVLRNGTKTDTWLLEPMRPVSSQGRSTASVASTTTSWSDVQDALQGGTIYFNTAGSLWPSLGALCRLVMYAFGLPTNCNVYVTPPGCTVSVPPHTDRQDVLVLQTEGYKRWRIFSPPKRQPGGRDPLDRGKQGDVLTIENLGQPLIDTIVGPGDVLYVPVGFPHITDTLNANEGNEHATNRKASVHLTMGLDTHVWMITMAHLRWALLQRCGLDFKIIFENDDDYWKAIETLPIGFLARRLQSSSMPPGGNCWQSTVESLLQGNGLTDEYLDLVANELEGLLIELEPNRWEMDNSNDDNQKTPLPSRQDMKDCISYMIDTHWKSILDSQADLSKVDLNPSSKEEAIIKAFQGTQNQDLIMERFAIFCKSEAMAKMYAERRMLAKSKTQGLY